MKTAATVNVVYSEPGTTKADLVKRKSGINHSLCPW